MSDPIVRVEDVTKRFGDVEALAGVSLQVDSGAIYSLLGPNGAGKTTIIRILATLLRPDSGTAWVAGLDTAAFPALVRNRIGLAGQFAAVDDFLTGRENVEMVGRLYNLPPAEVTRRATEVLERISLADAADRPVRTYSGGMRRRLDLAASMVGRPEVLFLDEPTTGIDPRSRADVWDLIEELVEAGTTILLTTQYLEEADRLASKIGVIDHGRLISEGTADELKDKIGGSVVEVIVPAADQDTAIKALGAVTGDDCTVDRRSGRLTIPAVDGPRTLTAAVRHLDDAGVEPVDIGLHKPTLDDVFLTLTGRATDTSPAEGHRASRRPERSHA